MQLYIGSNYNQVCDSKGPHNKAELTDLPDGTTHVKWLPCHRDNTSDYEKKWGGKYSWDNLYCWNSLPFDPPSVAPTKLAHLVDVMPLNLDDVNTWEFEVHAVPLPAEICNLAWQFTQVKPYRASTYNFGGKDWEKAFDLAKPVLEVGKWTTFCALHKILPKGPNHIGIQFNGNMVPVDIQRPYVESDGDKTPHINFAWQFDSLNKGKTIEALVRTRLVIA